MIAVLCVCVCVCVCVKDIKLTANPHHSHPPPHVERDCVTRMEYGDSVVYILKLQVYTVFSLCLDSHRTTVVKVEQVVSMRVGGGSAQAGRWEESNGWERPSMHTSLGELTTGDTDKCILLSPMLFDRVYYNTKIVMIVHVQPSTVSTSLRV